MQEGAAWPRVNTTVTSVSFEEEISIAAPKRVTPLSSTSSVPACCWKGKSLPGCVRGTEGSTKQRMEACHPHCISGAQGCALQLCGNLMLHPKAWVDPCQNNHVQPWALVVIPPGSVCAPPAGKPSCLLSPLTLSSQPSRRDTHVWPLWAGTTITLVSQCVHRVQAQAPAGARSSTPACQPPHCPHGLLI